MNITQDNDELADPNVAAGRLLHYAVNRQSLGRGGDGATYAALVHRMMRDPQFEQLFAKVAEGATYRVVSFGPDVGVLLGTLPGSSNAVRISDLVDKRMKGQELADHRILVPTLVLAVLATAYPASDVEGGRMYGQDLTPKDVADLVVRLSAVERLTDEEEVETQLIRSVADIVARQPKEVEGRRSLTAIYNLAVKTVRQLTEQGLLTVVDLVTKESDPALVRHTPMPALGSLVADAGDRVLVTPLRRLAAKVAAEPFMSAD